jgi:hypothetical protein
MQRTPLQRKLDSVLPCEQMYNNFLSSLNYQENETVLYKLTFSVLTNQLIIINGPDIYGICNKYNLDKNVQIQGYNFNVKNCKHRNELRLYSYK